jgi:hypothetical protein
LRIWSGASHTHSHLMEKLVVEEHMFNKEGTAFWKGQEREREKNGGLYKYLRFENCNMQCAQMISIFRHAVTVGKGSSKPPFRRSSPFLIWYASYNKRGFGNLMFPLEFTLLGGSFVFLDVSPSILFFVFPFYLFWVLWLVVYGWQGFFT